MIRISVLSLSLLTVMSGAAVAPAVADIIAFFPDASAMLGKILKRITEQLFGTKKSIIMPPSC